MKGFGRSHGSITVINAMPCGIGSTIGIDLETRCTFIPDGDGRTVTIMNDVTEDDGLTRICVRKAYEAMKLEEPECWSIFTDSQIPVSRGLKSSSAASNAIIRSIFDFNGFDMDQIDLIRLGVECAREARVTVTGAFDDACGCGLGGLVLTDNTRDELLDSRDIGDYDVVIHVPVQKIRKKGLPLEELRATAPDIRRAVDMAMDKPFEAMTINGRIISAVSGVDNCLAERALSIGALGAGMSGTGPAIAIVTEKNNGKGIVEELEMRPEETIITRTRCGQ
jgi:shikimate kinase